MPPLPSSLGRPKRGAAPSPLADPPAVRRLFIGVTAAFLGVLLLLPLATVFAEAFRDGLGNYLGTFRDAGTRKAICVTLETVAFVVPLNVAFGLAAAWCVARFTFPGKSLLLTLIDLPFSVSPIIAGLVWVLLFGAQGWWGPWLSAHGIRIVYAFPGIVLATAFVTFPFVARELIPLMQAQGSDEEYAALSLGARGWQMFWRITLPNIKWGLLYGVILCNAWAMGDFGAVSVVSGHIIGGTNTMPLQIEILYDGYKLSNAFALASLLTLLAIVTLVLKALVEWKTRPKEDEAALPPEPAPAAEPVSTP